VDWVGAVLTFFGLAGPVLALIRQPVVGWSSPEVWAPMIGGFVLLAVFIWHEARTPSPMLPLSLFKRRNFAIGNLQTFTMYGGLSIVFFMLVLYLQEVAGYSALAAGFALLPSTIVLFLLSKPMGRLADRHGPRLFMGLGPLGAAAGVALMLRLGAHVNYFTDLFPALLVFSLGLASTVAPLTAAVLSDADDSNAGIASGVNNAIARVAGLIAIAAVGAVISAQFRSSLDARLAGLRLSEAARAALAQARQETLARVDPARTGVAVAHAVQSSAVHAFHVGLGISATFIALGGIVGLAGIRNPRRVVHCADCPGGQIAGQPIDAARERTSRTAPASVALDSSVAS
jgi:predicted MFS family arabinose efflux permease